jgi:hypothetical protein
VIDNAQTQVTYSTIRSHSGKTGFRLVDPGNIVHSTDTTGIVTIVQAAADLGRVHCARGGRAGDQHCARRGRPCR